MLILSRRLNEQIVIDGQIKVQVIDIRGGRVRLAISAPRHVSIRREELPPALPAEATDLSFQVDQDSFFCQSL